MSPIYLYYRTLHAVLPINVARVRLEDVLNEMLRLTHAALQPNTGIGPSTLVVHEFMCKVAAEPLRMDAIQLSNRIFDELKVSTQPF